MTKVEILGDSPEAVAYALFSLVMNFKGDDDGAPGKCLVRRLTGVFNSSNSDLQSHSFFSSVVGCISTLAQRTGVSNPLFAQEGALS